MKAPTHSPVSAFAATLLCTMGLAAHAQVSAPPPPRAAVGLDGKRLVAPVESRVLADPQTRMYSLCTTGDEPGAPDGSAAGYVRPPKSEVITEVAAKARGYRPSAHRVSCN
jgi:hypothetical protein